ncbi:hypothetical protein B0H14DRAFT_3522584 [Mycena olivaceomarginata]|nr:hypothetical protein B0H14DRAFT_3522584 [Mycena olivaceomarginata]
MSNFSNEAFLLRMKNLAQNRPTVTPAPSPTMSETTTLAAPIPGLNLAHPRSATQNAVNAVDTFLNDTPTVREGKIFSLLLGLQNDVGNIIVAAPAFSVSAELQTNIKSYALAVMLSPKLAQYHGDLPVQHVINILKKHRFDMPPGIENNPADMQKITAAVQYAFTQDRSSLKKKNSTSSFWSSLDAAVSLMRTAADGNEEACEAMFEDLIIADKALHGAVDIVYQAMNNIQQEVDDLIVAGGGHEDPGAMDPPVDPTAEPEEDGAPGDGEEPQGQGPGQ